jgi:hypothetical protein
MSSIEAIDHANRYDALGTERAQCGKTHNDRLPAHLAAADCIDVSAHC